MRKLLMMAVLVGLMALPVYAQFRMDASVMTAFSLMGEGNYDGFLGLKSVQTELKLTDKQKEELAAGIKKVTDSYKSKIDDARDDMDFAKIRELMGKQNKEMAPVFTKFKDKLTKAQAKRFMQIRVQFNTARKNPEIFNDKDVQSALKLTDKQSKKIKSSLSDLAKDIKEINDDAKGDFKKMFANRAKIQKAREETYASLTKALTKDQNTTLAELGGDKFEVKELNFGGFGKDKGKKAKGKKKKTDDD